MPRAKRGEIWIADLGLAAKVRPVLVLSVAYEGQERAVCHETRGMPNIAQAGRTNDIWSIRRARSGFDTGDQTRKASGTRRF